MTDHILFKNFAISALSAGISPSDLTVNITPGTGTKFPSPTTGQLFVAVMFDAASNREIVHCTARSSDQLTIARGKENTTPRTWQSGDTIMLVGHSAGVLDEFIQRREVGYVNAGGTANALTVTPSPALLAYTAGLIIRFRVQTNNTGPVTVNVSGLGAVGLKNDIGLDLDADDLFGGQILEAVYSSEDSFFRIRSGLERYKVGETREWNSGTVPVGWLEENGQAVSRTTYARLFRRIGTTFGAGDGSTTFNLPDRRGRTAIGKGQGVLAVNVAFTDVDVGNDTLAIPSSLFLKTGTAVVFTTNDTAPPGLSSGTTYYAIRSSSTTVKLATTRANAVAATAIDITGQGAGTHTLTINLTSRSLADKIGEENHSMLVPELPVHNHGITDPGHLHGGVYKPGTGLSVSVGSDTTTGNTAAATTGITINNTGSSDEHNVIQPSIAKTFIMYAGQ